MTNLIGTPAATTVAVDEKRLCSRGAIRGRVLMVHIADRQPAVAGGDPRTSSLWREITRAVDELPPFLRHLSGRNFDFDPDK